MYNTAWQKKIWQYHLTNKALRSSYCAIWSIYFCSSTALIFLPLPPVLFRETFLHFRDKNHSLLFHSSSFVSVSHNMEITHPRVTSPPTFIKLQWASHRKQRDDSFMGEEAREQSMLSKRLNSLRLSAHDLRWKMYRCSLKHLWHVSQQSAFPFAVDSLNSTKH